MTKATQMLGNKSVIKSLVAITIAAALALPSLGCGLLVAGGAGAAGGYILRDEGYEVQSPIKKEEKAKSETKSE